MDSGTTRTPVTLARSDSRLLEAGGREYQVLVAWPAEPAPAGGYPVVYVLDPHSTFATTVESLRARTPRAAATGVKPAVIVGVGYPTADLQDRSRRTFDCTPPGLAPTDTEALRDLGPDGFGGADTFLDLLLGPIASSVGRDFQLSAGETTLMGHSLSALFVVHVLLTAPASFRTYVAASPSLWWAPEYLLRQADDLPSRVRRDRPIRVLLTVGEYEQKLAPWQPRSASSDSANARRSNRLMVDRVLEMGRALERLTRDGHRVETVEFPGEDHASALPATLSRGLRFGLID